MVDVSSVYQDPSGVVAALEQKYCEGQFYSDSPAKFYSAQYSSLVVGDTIYVLSDVSYKIAQAGFYPIYPFKGDGTEQYIEIDSNGKLVGTNTVNVVCSNPGDFNGDFGPDFNN